jgi:hypothetical protein
MIVILHFVFWLKKTKIALRAHNKGNKFYILNETKHNLENFSILYFIIPIDILYFMEN